MKILLLLMVGLGSSMAGEFVSLFNGKDLTGWGGKGKQEHAGYVVKEGGIIESTPECKFLMTEKEYDNYVFKFEFQLTPGANNGLGIHYPGEGDPAYTGMELQILDNTHPDYADKLKDYQYHGSLYTLQAAKRGHLRPVGEWNQETVTVNGPKVKVELNGVVIMEADLDGENREHPDHKGAERRKGLLTFCGHGAIIRLKNLEIKEL